MVLEITNIMRYIGGILVLAILGIWDQSIIGNTGAREA